VEKWPTASKNWRPPAAGGAEVECDAERRGQTLLLLAK